MPADAPRPLGSTQSSFERACPKRVVSTEKPNFQKRRSQGRQTAAAAAPGLLHAWGCTKNRSLMMESLGSPTCRAPPCARICKPSDSKLRFPGVLGCAAVGALLILLGLCYNCAMLRARHPVGRLQIVPKNHTEIANVVKRLGNLVRFIKGHGRTISEGKKHMKSHWKS